MSGSPKYTTVRYDPVREAALRRQREEQRRRMEAERRRRAAEAAARRERARAERARRDAERAAARAARDAERSAAVRKAGSESAARRLREVQGLLDGARDQGLSAAELAAVGERIDALRSRLAHDDPQKLDEAIEELRGRLVRAGSWGGASPAGGQDHERAVAELEARLRAVPAEQSAADEEGRQRSAALLKELREAARAGDRVRFEALRGTAEFEIGRHAATATEQARKAEETRREQVGAAAAAEAEATAAAARAAEEAEALAEARDRLDAVRDDALAAIGDAATFGEPALTEDVARALTTAQQALGAGAPAAALAAAAELAELLPAAEQRLDDLLLAHQRRVELAEAVKEAMTDEGLAFTGGEEDGARFLLRFERPNGALYETAVGSEDDGTPLLVYRIEGEADISRTAAAEGGEAVCDSTEELLERVHEAMHADGFVPGELHWQGKPPGRRGRALPGDESGRLR
ncbi:hypothetical protein G5C51_29405 [Streptomyces sp. A7024]|uniref:Uncharacterized protein n=1 Tax=Streptomyces coryli TaxID=1128680 RepID=A0A6G4U747_9ACTN|nr:hypothetical protein [Streptomyces coryli]NGN68004.1 hypothetical protein [Streptomyces coryli]